MPKPGDRSNFNTHKTCWKCCYNNERPTGQKQLLDGRTVEHKGKLIIITHYILNFGLVLVDVLSNKSILIET